MKYRIKKHGIIGENSSFILSILIDTKTQLRSDIVVHKRAQRKMPEQVSKPLKEQNNFPLLDLLTKIIS